MALSHTGPRLEFEKVQLEIDAMTDREREKIQHDVFGSTSAIHESPLFNRDALERLAEELDNFMGEREAFDLAQMICPDYVNSDEFRLMFLRSERFDVQAAARKLVYYWDRKVELFGPERAFRKLTIEDLDNEEDIVALENGGLRALPHTDSAGRGIVFSLASYWDRRKTHDRSMLRLLWFSHHEVLKNIDVQRNGIVSLIANDLPASSHITYNAKLNRKIWNDVCRALPIRCQAFHFALENEISKMVLSTNLAAVSKRLRTRLCLHSIKHSQLVEELEAYGIAKDVVPFEFGGSLDFDYRAHLEELRNNIGVDER